jgi:ribonuclease G
MSEEILINVTPVETRVALVENGMLQEAYIERASRKGIVGNIYKGKVVRVLPGMEPRLLISALSVRPSFTRLMWLPVSQVVMTSATAPVWCQIFAPCCAKVSRWWCRSLKILLAPKAHA